MTIEKVDFIPKDERERPGNKTHDLQSIIDDFMKRDDQIIKITIDHDDYKSPRAAYNCFRSAVQFSGYAIKVVKRKNAIYLQKMK